MIFTHALCPEHIPILISYTYAFIVYFIVLFNLYLYSMYSIY